MKDKSTPLVLASDWADTIPQWLRDAVEAERIIIALGDLTKRKERRSEKIGNAEVIGYLMTWSLQQPLPSEYANVYIYLAAEMLVRTRQKRKEELEDFVREKLEQGLTDDERRALQRLKSWLYDKRGGDYQHPAIEIWRTLRPKEGLQKLFSR